MNSINDIGNTIRSVYDLTLLQNNIVRLVTINSLRVSFFIEEDTSKFHAYINPLKKVLPTAKLRTEVKLSAVSWETLYVCKIDMASWCNTNYNFHST